MAGFIPQSVLVQAMGAWIDHSERRFYSASTHGKSLIWPHGILRVDLEPLEGTVGRTLTPIVLSRTLTHAERAATRRLELDLIGERLARGLFALGWDGNQDRAKRP